MSRAIVAILGIVLVGAVGIFGFQAALADAGDNRIVVNETWTPDAGNVTQLENSDRTGAYYGNETDVYNASGVEVERGTDYVWFDTNGTVKAVAGGALDGESSATITYTYQQTTSEQRQLATLLAMFTRVVPVFLPVLGIVLLLIFINN